MATTKNKLTITEGKIEFGMLILGMLDKDIPRYRVNNSLTGISSTIGELTYMTNIMYAAEVITDTDKDSLMFLINNLNFNTLKGNLDRIYNGIAKRIEFYKNPFDISNADKMQMSGLTMEVFNSLKNDINKSVEFLEAKYPCIADISKMCCDDDGFHVAIDIRPN